MLFICQHAHRIDPAGPLCRYPAGNEGQNCESDIELFDDCLHKDDEIISERFMMQSGLLKELESV